MTTKTYVPGLALVKKDGEDLTIADLGQVTEGLLTDTSLEEYAQYYARLEEADGTVGATNKIIYVNTGVVTESDKTTGGTAKPIYLSEGVLTPISDTVGSGVIPTYLNAGTVTASSSTVGSGTKHVYLNAGTVTASSSTVGSGTKPVYMSSGAMTASSSTVGSSTTPVYLSSGTITACSQSLSTGAYPTVKQATLSSKKFYAPSGGTWWCCGCYTYSRSGTITLSSESTRSYRDNTCIPVAKSVSGGGLIATSSYTVVSNGITCIQIAS